MTISLSHYRTCIIRVWIEEGTDETERAWRLTIETPSTGERRGFSSREEFMKALARHLFTEEAENNSEKSGSM